MLLIYISCSFLYGSIQVSQESNLAFGKLLNTPFPNNFIDSLTTDYKINENDLNNYPIAKEPKVALPNNHLQYSITWGMLAVIFLIMNYIYLRKNK